MTCSEPLAEAAVRMKSLHIYTLRLTIINSKVSRCDVLQHSAVVVAASVVNMRATLSFFKLQKPKESNSRVKRITGLKNKASATGSVTT